MQFAGNIVSNHPALIWRVWATPKCKYFVWLLLQNSLWTAARLQLRGWTNNYFCALCEQNMETTHHLFFECPFSLAVWHSIALWSGFSNLDPSSWTQEDDLEDQYSQAFRAGDTKGQSLVILTLWNIWNCRNDVIFRGVRKTVQVTLTMVKDTAQH